MRHVPAIAVLAIAVFAAARTARADVEVGQDAPEIAGREYVNSQPVKLADLRGRVVVVQIFRTNSQPSAEQVPKLEELQTKYGDRGLTVLAVTNEERKPVDEFVGRLKATYPVVIESGDMSKSWGLAKGFPTTYVVGADGKVVWKGNWADKAEDKISLLVAKALKSPRLPVRFAAQRDAAEAGRLGEARKPLAEELKAGTLSDTEKPLVEKMIAWIDAQYGEQLDAAVAAANAGKFYEADVEFERLAKECADIEIGKKAAEGRRQLRADPARVKEIDGGRALAAAQEKAKDLPAPKAIALYRDVVKKFKDTEAAKKAAELIAELEKK
jgi:peroxiredoxin